MNHFDDFPPLFDADQHLDDPLGDASPALERITGMLDELSDLDVMRLQTALHARVPMLLAEDINLSAEVADTFRNAKILMAETTSNRLMDPGKKATTVRTLTQSLRALFDLQVRSYNIETSKTLERCLMETLSTREDAAEIIEDFRGRFSRAVGRDPLSIPLPEEDE